jgi:hypothetical protein
MNNDTATRSPVTGDERFHSWSGWLRALALPKFRNTGSVALVVPALFLLVAACGGSTHPDVDAHELRVTLTMNGVQTEGVVTVPEYDGDAQYSRGDSSCKLLSGNCGHPNAVAGRMAQGTLPLESAGMSAWGSSGDVYINYSFRFNVMLPELPAGQNLGKFGPQPLVCRAQFQTRPVAWTTDCDRGAATLGISVL